MGIVNISQQIPSILFRSVEKKFLDGIVIVVGDASADIFVPSLRHVTVCLPEERPLPAAVAIEGLDKGRCGCADEYGVHFPLSRFDEIMDMIEHQRQCQNCDLIVPRHDRKDGIIDQSILHRIEDEEHFDGPLVNVLENLRREFSQMTAHNRISLTSIYAKSSTSPSPCS